MNRMNIQKLGAGLRVLAVAALAAAAGACDSDPVPPFSIGGTGTLEAFAFHDVDDDGVYDAADADLPLDNLHIVVVERGTDRVLGEVVTDIDGRVTLSGLPAGTHEAVIDLTTVPDGIRVCQERTNITIYPGETRFLGVVGRNGCLILIGTLQQRLASGQLAFGDGVVVRGVVTVDQGVFSGTKLFVQDATGGMFVVDVPGALGLQEGDSVQIAGTLQADGGTSEPEIAVTAIEQLGTGTVPAPVTVTGSQVVARTVEGELATVEGVTVTAIAVFGGGFSANVTVAAPDGTAFVVRFDNQAGAGVDVTSLFTVGSTYDVTGIVASYQGAGQLKPRSAADVVPQ